MSFNVFFTVVESKQIVRCEYVPDGDKGIYTVVQQRICAWERDPQSDIDVWAASST